MKMNLVEWMISVVVVVCILFMLGGALIDAAFFETKSQQAARLEPTMEMWRILGVDQERGR
jgi:hypothetical protein